MDVSAGAAILEDLGPAAKQLVLVLLVLVLLRRIIFSFHHLCLEFTALAFFAFW